MKWDVGSISTNTNIDYSLPQERNINVLFQPLDGQTTVDITLFRDGHIDFKQAFVAEDQVATWASSGADNTADKIAFRIRLLLCAPSFTGQKNEDQPTSLLPLSVSKATFSTLEQEF